MAKQVIKKKVSRIKTKRKTWYKILAPKLFSNREIGETYLASTDSAIGRVLKVNLREMTGNVKDQNAYMKFVITAFRNSVFETSTIGFGLSPAFIKRLVRKNTARVDDHFILTTKTGQKLIIKALMVSRNKVQHSVKTELRKQLHDLLEKEVAQGDIDTLIGNVVGYKLQSMLKKKLHKVSPMKEVTMRSVVLKGKVHIPKPVPKPVEKPVEVKEDAKVEEPKAIPKTDKTE
ncbi:hypothetical protein HOL21_03725 [Candidatus Woesearchaeota archaeon]|jgi:small subunit ribosomal protein S3Ae|nr:hypothetical protein [Candidatus Woesearchaeota archaeon]MBT5397294.1 hypothetical protein [Candidatus Woesearchaeota archaeon]MBT5924281.1 hypothetical protein [Candidatus Woesearchaeota archaeon]MBT6367861.1 hypothetical protein [Candidatus Woesearchaeota archaeon]MBT7762694.1 hypothetical protein [Candidatus Woesearchaeota archaeon]